MTEKSKNPLLKWGLLHLIAIALIGAAMFYFLKPGKGAPDNDTVIYLVRHAEKITGENAGRDPALTDAGQTRANVLAEILRDKHITYVHSSNYIRTRDTAAPLAKIADVEIEIYDPRDLPALAVLIKQQGGKHLVVGHSNTIPETVTALGGDGGSPIFEKSEYDRLYVVRILDDDAVYTDLKRYGTRYKPAE